MADMAADFDDELPRVVIGDGHTLYFIHELGGYYTASQLVAMEAGEEPVEEEPEVDDDYDDTASRMDSPPPGGWPDNGVSYSPMVLDDDDDLIEIDEAEWRRAAAGLPGRRSRPAADDDELIEIDEAEWREARRRRGV